MTDDIENKKIINTNVKWTEDHENILVEWADKALCYRWLHGKSHQQYKRANTWFTIPVIIMSTLTGTANFAQDKFSGATREYVAVGIGAVNIIAGIITTIQQFLKISELNEAHRVSSLSWDKFYRNIKVDLAKSPKERTPVLQMLKSSKEEFDRLMETSPAISTKVTEAFKKEFSCTSKQKEDVERELKEKQNAFMSLKKPEICGTLETSKLSVYKPNKEITRIEKNIVVARQDEGNDCMRNNIKDIIINFKKSRLREPTNSEIMDELDINDLDKETSVEMINTTKQNMNDVLNDENV